MKLDGKLFKRWARQKPSPTYTTYLQFAPMYCSGRLENPSKKLPSGPQRTIFTSVFYKCILQVYFTSVFYKCILQVYFTSVFYKCILQVNFALAAWSSGVVSAC
jgi:hypothetical protein